MVRMVDYTNRRNKVLAATVAYYIRKGQPVSSQELCDAFDLSSATIRNILAELEEGGYLSHPHTSAGKTPSNKGYRYYVDFLMSETELPSEQKTVILEEYKNRVASLEEALEKTSEIIATRTHYASIVSFFEWGDRIFYRGLSNIIEHPEFHDVHKLAFVLKLLEERKQLLDILNQEINEPLRVYIGEEMGCPDLSDTCSLVVSTYRMKNKEKGRLAVLGPRRMSYEQAVSTLEFIAGTLNSVLEDF
jgi:heat-inducible transcriptional repressor